MGFVVNVRACARDGLDYIHEHIYSLQVDQLEYADGRKVSRAVYDIVAEPADDFSGRTRAGWQRRL
jgi:hypothetical protein